MFSLDTLVHNFVALGVAIIVVLVLSQLVMATVLRVASRFLSSSLFSQLTTGDRDAFRSRVRRATFVVVAIVFAVLLAGSLVASFFGIRALAVTKAAIARLSGEDIATVGTRVVKALGIVLGAVLVDAIARAIATLFGKALERSRWLMERGEALGVAMERLRVALRTAILCAASLMIVDTLGLPPGAQRAVAIVGYVLVAFYTSHLVVRIAHLGVDLLFDVSGMLSRLDGPLKYLGSLNHLAGITKRAIEYFVFVGAATWVADALTPGTWLSRAGRIGIRVVAIFYASRVVVEVCLLFINELFLNKAGHSEAQLQQRRTLIPVAVGLLRYGIYFSALIMVLREAEVDPTPLLAGAGVLGVAVGLGAQAFVGDIVAGFFILFENLLLVGDLVEVSSVRGKVEEIGVRITKIRDDAGVLHAIPNGEVRKVSSHSKGYVNATVDVYVPYEEDPRRVRALLAKVAEDVLQAETGARGNVEVKVQELSEGSVTFRVSARVAPGRDEDVSDALRAKILEDMRDAGIGAPRARRAVLIDDGGLRIAPAAEPKEEDATAPLNPFKPPEPSE